MGRRTGLSAVSIGACACVAVVALVVLALAGCSQGVEPDRAIDQTTEFDHQLVVEDLAVGYPDDMREVVDEAEVAILPYSSTTFGNAPVCAFKAVRTEGVVIMLEAAEPGSGCTLSDVEAHCEELESTVGVADEFGVTRRALSKERALVNGMPCVIIDTTIQAAEERGGRIARGIVYVLADGSDAIIGQMAAYFGEGDYEEDPGLYDAIFASVRLVDGAGREKLNDLG